MKGLYNKYPATPEIDAEIWEIYDQKKQAILQASEKNEAEECLTLIYDLWMFMNRFRNCVLKFYYDEDLNQAIQNLNPHRYDTSHLLKPKDEYKIAFVFGRFNDAGGAAFTHRYILEKAPGFKQYVLVTNSTNSPDYKDSERYQYMRDWIDLEKFHFMEPNDSHVEKGRQVQEWLYEHQIDFAFVQPDPSTMYALASRPVLIDATFSADPYCFTVGPGTGDYTYLVTSDQIDKYKFRESGYERHLKNIWLPLPPKAFVDKEAPADRQDFDLPQDVTLSVSTNMWKCCFGDDETLLEGIAALMRKFPNYHHLLLGTPRCLDNVDFFLSKNPDVKNRFHYVGVHPHIYPILKMVDFYINSYPTSGASNTEAALCGKPSIDFFADKELALHNPEFLRDFECEVVSLEEFVQLGSRFITDPEYRSDLGQYLQKKVLRELDKQRLAKEKIYDHFVYEFERRLEGRKRMRSIQLDRTVAYEKGIALYNAHGQNAWPDKKQKDFLSYCTTEFPNRPFGWIKSLEKAITLNDKNWFQTTANQLSQDLLKDHRIQVMLAIGFDQFDDRDKSLDHATQAVDLTTHDQIPYRVAARFMLAADQVDRAVSILDSSTDTDITADNIKTVLDNLPSDQLPLFYDY